MNFINESKVKYLELLQGIISRIAGNSFAIKNWFIISFGGLLSLFFTKGKQQEVLLVAVIVIVLFYLWDVNYLYLERIFREKYSLALDDKTKLFDMEIRDLKSYRKWISVFKSFAFVPYWMAFSVVIIVLLAY